MSTNRNLQRPLYRVFSVFIVFVASVIGILDVLPLVFTGNAAIVHANGLPAAPRNIAQSYQWNLRDETKPLISFPDHIGGNLDLALTYSLDQFQFPLFQTLYFNQRAGKYILMVLSKEKGRAEFIELSEAGRAQFVSDEKSNLRLNDKGGLKVLSAADGTSYTFAKLSDGEFHCGRIDDSAGSVIKLKYSNDALLNAIADDAGRMITFSYDDNHVSAITQTWKFQTAKMIKTWAIANHEQLHAGPSSTLPVGPIVPKRIPSNAITPGYTKEMEASDNSLAALFGGNGAVAAANGFEPRSLGNQYPLYRGNIMGDDGKVRRGHLSYAMHLYGSEDGTGETELYVPAGFTSHSGQPSPTDAAVTFYYSSLGNLTNVTLAVFHVDNFRLVPEGMRVRIGKIGGPGGSIDSYKHSHVEFYRGDTGLPRASARARLRIDPAGVFTSNTEALARGKSAQSETEMISMGGRSVR